MKTQFQGKIYTFWFSYQIVTVDERLHKPTALPPAPKPARILFASFPGRVLSRPPGDPEYDEEGYRAANRAWHEAHTEACTCHIAFGPAELKPQEVEMPQVEAQVIRHHRDTPNRRKAREEALTKALKQLDCDYPLYSPGGPDAPPTRQALMQKDRRAAFWLAYFQECRASANTQASRDRHRVIELTAVLRATCELLESYQGTEPLRARILSAVGR